MRGQVPKDGFGMDGGFELVVVEAIKLATNDKRQLILWDSGGKLRRSL